MTLLQEPAGRRMVSETDMGTPAVPGEPTVELEIDGMTVTVPEGTSIMRAAAEAGIDVPKLCAALECAIAIIIGALYPAEEVALAQIEERLK